MRVDIRRGFLNEVHNAGDTEALCVRAAEPIAARIESATPRATGATAATTHVEGGHRTADGRSVAAWIVQDHAAVQQQFGNAHENTPARQFDRGRGQ